MVDDAMLRDMSLALKHLRRLTLWGCIRVTREGVYKILREAEDIEELSLDAMPHSVCPASKVMRDRSLTRVESA